MNDELMRKALSKLWFKSVRSVGVINKEGKRVDGFGLNEIDVNKIMALFDKYRNDLLNEVEAKLPKDLKESDYVLNMGVTHNPPSNTTRTNLTRQGYNKALENARKVIQSMRSK